MASAPLSLRYQSKQHPYHMLESISDLYHTGSFCDIILNVGSYKIRAHKVILAAFSPYFRSMFEPNSDNQNRPEVTLSNIDEEAVKLLVDFCYTGTIIVDSQTVDRLMTAVTVMQLREVEKLCMTFLTAQQTMSGELSPVKTSLQSCLQFNRCDKGCTSNYSDLVPVESSGVFSPHTSPSVSASEQGAVSIAESSDVDVMLVKSEPVDLSLESPTGQDSHSLGSAESALQQTSFRRFTPPVIHTSHLQNLLQFPPRPISLQAATTRPIDVIVPNFTSPGLMSSPQISSQSVNLSPGAAFPNTGTGNACGVPPLSISSQEFARQILTQTNNSESPIQCPVCNQTCSCPETLEIHMELHDDVGTVPKLPKKTSFHSLQKNNDGPTDRSLPMCVTCGKCFKDLQSLKFHRYNHILRFSCTMCGKRFSRSWNLHRHKKTHFRPDIWHDFSKREVKLEPPVKEEDVIVSSVVSGQLRGESRLIDSDTSGLGQISTSTSLSPVIVSSVVSGQLRGESRLIDSDISGLGQISTSTSLSPVLELCKTDPQPSNMEPGQINPVISSQRSPTYTDLSE